MNLLSTGVSVWSGSRLRLLVDPDISNVTARQRFHLIVDDLLLLQPQFFEISCMVLALSSISNMTVKTVFRMDNTSCVPACNLALVLGSFCELATSPSIGTGLLPRLPFAFVTVTFCICYPRRPKELKTFQASFAQGPCIVLIRMLARITHWRAPIHVETSCSPFEAGNSASSSNGVCHRSDLLQRAARTPSEGDIQVAADERI